MSRALYKSFCEFKSIRNIGRQFQLSLKREMADVAICEAVAVDNKKRLLSEEASDIKRPRLEVDRVKRKKVAMLLSYSGQGYFGMQRNPETKTIEEDLLTAMHKAGFISEDAFVTAQTIQFQRAARTDKGVSAARQIVSLKLPEEANVDQINDHLPDQIRTFAIKRTTKGFNCKSSCDARTYSYMLPTYAFAPITDTFSKTFKITQNVLDNVATILKMFEGTHNFHNFTSKKKPGDPSATRYIMSFECGIPFVKDDLEFVVIKVKGQSFMLHQIRKMVGLAIAVVKGLTISDTITKAWGLERLDIPVAPGLGLVLDEVHYDRYNQRYGSDGIHESLTWDAFEDDINVFKDKFIYPVIVDTEVKEESMLNWLLTLPLHTYDIREEHLHHSSTLPQEETEESVGENTVVSSGSNALVKAAEIIQEQQENVNIESCVKTQSDEVTVDNQAH